jgi:hypothetical protein
MLLLMRRGHDNHNTSAGREQVIYVRLKQSGYAGSTSLQPWEPPFSNPNPESVVTFCLMPSALTSAILDLGMLNHPKLGTDANGQMSRAVLESIGRIQIEVCGNKNTNNSYSRRFCCVYMFS